MKLFHINWIGTIVFLITINSYSQTQTLDSLTLDQAIQQVIQNHPLIEQAEQQIRAAQARLDQSESLLYPQLEALGLYSRVGPVPTLDIPNMGHFSLFPENNYDAHLSANQIVFDFGRRSSQNALARSRKHLAEDNSIQIKSMLAYQTVRTFYIILFLHENIRLLDEEIVTLNAHLSTAKKKLQTGSATDFDVLTIRVRVANAHSEKVEVESALEKHKIALKRLLGMPLDQSISLQGNFNLPDEKINPDSLVSIALSLRPEMIQARDAETSLQIQTHLSSLGNKPSLLANLSFGIKNGYVPNLDQAKINWLAGVRVQMPLFDGFRTRYRTEESQADLETARAHSLDVAQQISSEVNQALIDVQARKDKIKTSALQLEQAEQALALAKTQYEIGVITNLDLLVAQTAHHEANLKYVKALYEMILSRFALKETVGSKMWM